MLTGTEFRKWREANNYSQSSFGREVGVNPAGVSAFELGRVKCPAWLKSKKVKALIAPKADNAKVVEGKVAGMTLLSTFVESREALNALTKRLSLADIAAMAGCTSKTVELWVKEHKLVVSKKLSLKELAEELGE